MSFKQNLNALQIFWRETCDKRTCHLPGIGDGPWITIIVILLYILFVTWIGSKLMANRKPFLLRGPMLAYNILMVRTLKPNKIFIYFFYKYNRLL